MSPPPRFTPRARSRTRQCNMCSFSGSKSAVMRHKAEVHDAEERIRTAEEMAKKQKQFSRMVQTVSPVSFSGEPPRTESLGALVSPSQAQSEVSSNQSEELPCRCGGGNENCAFCFGSGKIHERRESSYYPTPRIGSLGPERRVRSKAERVEDAKLRKRMTKAARRAQQQLDQLNELRTLAAKRALEWRERESKRVLARQLAKAQRQELIDDLMLKSECEPSPLPASRLPAPLPEPPVSSPAKALAADVRKKMTLREAFIAQGRKAEANPNLHSVKPAPAVKPEKKPPIRCPLCNKNVAADRTKLGRHFDSKHPIESPEFTKRHAHSPKDRRRMAQPLTAPDKAEA